MGEPQKPSPNPNSDIKSYDKAEQRVLQTCPYCEATRAVKISRVHSDDNYLPYCNQNHARAHDKQQMDIHDVKEDI